MGAREGAAGGEEEGGTMTSPVAGSPWCVEERVVPLVKLPALGVDRQWEVTHTQTQAMRVVVLTKRSLGRFGGPPQWRCTCGLTMPRRSCAHVKAVQATLPPVVA